MPGDIWALKGSGEVLYNVHKQGQCHGYWCTIHRPMSGPWDAWPMRFLANIVMVRICPCGYAHPAIEDVINGVSYADHDHYCDCECGFEVWLKRRDFRAAGGTTMAGGLEAGPGRDADPGVVSDLDDRDRDAEGDS